MRRPFVKARQFWVAEFLPAMALGTCRESAYFTSFADGPLDAPVFITAGSMRATGYKGHVVAVRFFERGAA